MVEIEVDNNSINNKIQNKHEKYDDPPEKLKKWHRKKLDSLLKKLLFPASWSLLILSVGILFTLLDYRTNFSEFIGAILLFLGPISLGISIIFISNSHDNSKPLMVISGMIGNTRIIWLIISIILIYIGIKFNPDNQMFWNLMIVPNLILWIEWFIFSSFYFSSPSAIWLTNYNHNEDLPMEKLCEQGWEWKSESLKPLNSLIAIKKYNGTILELSSIKYEELHYLSLSWWQKGGIRHDPFVSEKVRGLAIPTLTKLLGYKVSEFDMNLLNGIEFLRGIYCKNK